jgi:predicted Zn-dependent protease
LAIEHYRQALLRHLPGENVEQRPVRIRKELAECLLRVMEFTSAWEILETLKPLAEDLPLVEALRGECLAGLGRPQEARNLLTAALGQASNCFELLRACARLDLEANEPQEAITHLERALLFDRSDHESLYLLTTAYQKVGRDKEAGQTALRLEENEKVLTELQKLEQEASAKPWNRELRLRSALLCDKVERPAEAAAWRRAAAACSGSQSGAMH